MRCITGIVFIALNMTVEAQQYSSDSVITPEVGVFPKEDLSVLHRVSVSGFYRFFATQTRQFIPYILNAAANQTTSENQLFIGDDSQLPTLQLNVSGRPTLKTSWAFDIYTYQYLNGDLDETYGNQVADSLRPGIQNPIAGTRLGPSMILNLGINFTGTHETDFGVFTIRAGGIQWIVLSDLTMGSFKGYNRFTLFEQNPWDPVSNNVTGRYEKYFNEGAIDQDARWGNRAFKGFVLEAAQLPGAYDAKLLIGKTELNGGFSAIPNIAYGGRVVKKLNEGAFYAVNTINSFTYADSLAAEGVGFNQFTLEIAEFIKGIAIHAEVGLGKYFSPQHNTGWGEAISATITTPIRKKMPQLSVHYFRISPDVINNNSVFLNTSYPEYVTNDIPAGSVGSNAVLRPLGSSMIRMWQMANNRQGLDFNLEQTWKKLAYNIGIGATGELIALSNVINFTHPVNALTRSRLWRFTFPEDVGPYNRYSVIFRDVYETATLNDDSSGIAVNKKYFSVFEPQLKYKTKVFNRTCYLYYLGYYSTAQKKWSFIPITNEEAYIRQYVSEFEMYFHISEGIVLSGYYGYERTLGNYQTDISDETTRPRNQTGVGYGAGMDVDLGRNAVLYLRNKWFLFEDINFVLDTFRGQETIVELKIFF
ncbi:MAG: hypothetical protein ACK4IY_01690 [Chitinophagales bacterium]